jgi:hypothetical protein
LAQRLAFGLFEALVQVVNGLFQLRDAPIALRELFAQVLILAELLFVGRGVYADLDRHKPYQLGRILVKLPVIDKRALNKHHAASLARRVVDPLGFLQDLAQAGEGNLLRSAPPTHGAHVR